MADQGRRRSQNLMSISHCPCWLKNVSDAYTRRRGSRSPEEQHPACTSRNRCTAHCTMCLVRMSMDEQPSNILVGNSCGRSRGGRRGLGGVCRVAWSRPCEQDSARSRIHEHAHWHHGPRLTGVLRGIGLVRSILHANNQQGHLNVRPKRRLTSC